MFVVWIVSEGQLCYCCWSDFRWGTALADDNYIQHVILWDIMLPSGAKKMRGAHSGSYVSHCPCPFSKQGQDIKCTGILAAAGWARREERTNGTSRNATRC